jgi:hypothetical protein
MIDENIWEGIIRLVIARYPNNSFTILVLYELINNPNLHNRSVNTGLSPFDHVP